MNLDGVLFWLMSEKIELERLLTNYTKKNSKKTNGNIAELVKKIIITNQSIAYTQELIQLETAKQKGENE